MARSRDCALPMAQLEIPFDDGPVGDPCWLTIAEAADRVRCCERTIRRAIDSGALRAGRVRGVRGSRGAVRIRAEDIAEWLFAEDES
ncbi:MAG: DNA-binding protein [Solirubrobacterales bacterium]|nr:DNA-binding protein [Solirubrobacterales bacterium]